VMVFKQTTQHAANSRLAEHAHCALA